MPTNRDPPNSSKRWSIVAPFFSTHGVNRWIDDFVTDRSWDFQKIPFVASDDWHLRTNRATGMSKWLQYWSQSRRAFPAAGVITLFPQPAVTTSLRKTLLRTDVPLLAWCFNLGQYPHGLKRVTARTALRSVNRFVVHSTGEIDRVSEFLDIPRRKVEFVPLQRAPIPSEASEDLRSPFVAALGSANRDYRTFFQAAELAGLPCKVVASPRALMGLRVPENVSVEFGLSSSECHRIVQRSRFSVVPLLDKDVAAGQVTVVESMRMNKPVIATESIGTVDYIEQGRTGVLLPACDPKALATAMVQLWEDLEQREQYARNAAAFAESSLSDEAASRALTRILRELELER